jgi:hypothetical protein
MENKKAPQHTPRGKNDARSISQNLNQVNREITQLRDLASALMTIGLVLAGTMIFIFIVEVLL